jgi:hypothetical protein
VVKEKINFRVSNVKFLDLFQLSQRHSKIQKILYEAKFLAFCFCASAKHHLKLVCDTYQ